MNLSNEMSLALCVLGVNVLSFLLFGLDKLLAKQHFHRIPEATLLTLSVLSGSVGAMCGMLLFRHKTDARAHPGFVWGVPAMFLVQLAVCFLLSMRL